MSYYAGNNAGDFVSSDVEAVNAVTWGAFAGKEYAPSLTFMSPSASLRTDHTLIPGHRITTPTIIEQVSFRAWLEEAFSIEIPDEDTEQIKTVKDAIDYIKTHGKAA